MNRKIGIIGSAVNLASVIAFAISMLLSDPFASYLSSIFIAFSFVAMASSFAQYSGSNKRAAGYCTVAFSAMYAACNAIVYFTQLTVVRGGTLTGQAAALLDFQQFGLMFSLDMLGYCHMAVATFFLGLTIDAKTLADKWLKWLLLIHGIFSVTCFVMPMLGLFHPGMGGGDFIGTVILEFWCFYFIPIGLLSARHFFKKA